ncbi:hypothetical protein ACSFXN_18400 [Planococcus sp. 1R117A]|uniref:hypothetical protein n=1 Tax=Planococcus sp. 1R117A TaxID=3447020 RepID=UPI003EDC2DDD
MVIRTIANKVGTIEVNGNSFYFLQPLSTFQTDQMEQIQQAYERRLASLQEDTHYLAAKSLTFQSGQVQFEYDLRGLKAFDYLKTLYFEDKLPYYLSLVRIAQRMDVTVLWQKENFMVDEEEQELRAAVLENDELKLQNSKSRLDAIKELIIVSLTSLNQVLGRPKRSDFFEQDEEVIRFAEMVYLRLTTLDELESFITQVHAEIIDRKRIEEEGRQLLAANKKRFSLTNLNFAKLFNVSGEKKNLRPHMEVPQKKKVETAPVSKENNVRFLAGVGGILIVAVLLNVLLTNANENAEAKDANDEVSKQEINLEETYRQGLLGNEVTVMETLETIGYDSLEKEEREVLEALYVKNEEYNKALENNPELAGEIAAKLVKSKDIKKLEEIRNSLAEPKPIVDFELAAATKDWQTVIDLRNQIEMTDAQIASVVTAFIQTGDLQTAKGFVDETAGGNEELLNRVLEAEKKQNELAALKLERAEKQKVIDTDTDKKKIKVAQNRIKEIDKRMEVLMKEMKNG